jgi:hypothetical protein
VGVGFLRPCVASFNPVNILEAAAEVEAHSRFTIEEDGRIAPNVTGTFVEHLGGRFVLGLNAGGVALVNRGPFPEGVPAPLFFKATF